MAQTLESRFQRCCRLCAEEQEVTIMIFSDEAEAMLLQNKLNKYLLIEVDEDDKLPKYICIQCCTKLQTVCEFIDTARKAQDILLNRSILLDQVSDNCSLSIIKCESVSVSDDESKITEMEVNVDPMMVLQNSDDEMSPIPNNTVLSSEDTTNIHSVDGEYVTIKLIKKVDKSSKLENKKDSKPFPCFICKRSFLTELALKNHSWIHIGEEKMIDRQYHCPQCPQSFDYKNDLIVHLKDHRTKGMCQECGRVFRTQENLAAHMILHKSSCKSYTCKVCGRSYNTQSNLTTHSITHSNERPYQCHICKKKFKRNQDLKFHINQHTGAKPYKCPFCDKSFASSGNCYSHRSRMHPGCRLDNSIRRKAPNTSQSKNHETQGATKSGLNKGIHKYKCQYCDHSFIRRDNFTYHMYQHTGKKPFQCSYCSEKFVTRKGLLLHHDKDHQEKDRPLALLSKNILLQ